MNDIIYHIDKAHKFFTPVISRTETVIVSQIDKTKISTGGQHFTCCGTVAMSDPRGDNEVLKALRRFCNLVAKNGTYYINTKKDSTQIWKNIESTLRDFGFQQQEFYVKTNEDESGVKHNWKYSRTVQE